MEVTDIPKVVAGVNANFVSTAAKGALVMAGEYVDLDSLQDAAAASGADIWPTECGVQRAVRAVSKKWWCSFGYDYVLGAIRTRLQ
jgi:hypothetical protein